MNFQKMLSVALCCLASFAFSQSETADLPLVLIVGDSISMGYTKPVQELLKGKAVVSRIPANGGPTTRGLANIEKWLGETKWDVIHFNWGIHDLKFMPHGKRQVEVGAYETNLRALVKRLKQTNAKLVWATITPIPNETLIKDRNFGDENEYNEIAAKIMSAEGVATNDLNAFITPRFEELQVTRDLHFKPEGSKFLAKKVAAEIEKALSK